MRVAEATDVQAVRYNALEAMIAYKHSASIDERPRSVCQGTMVLRQAVPPARWGAGDPEKCPPGHPTDSL
jgi:hypothetical protein